MKGCPRCCGKRSNCTGISNGNGNEDGQCGGGSMSRGGPCWGGVVRSGRGRDRDLIGFGDCLVTIGTARVGATKGGWGCWDRIQGLLLRWRGRVTRQFMMKHSAEGDGDGGGIMTTVRRSSSYPPESKGLKPDVSGSREILNYEQYILLYILYQNQLGMDGSDRTLRRHLIIAVKTENSYFEFQYKFHSPLNSHREI